MTFPSNIVKATEHIVCPTCSNKSTRVGAQDSCDIYVCESNHLTRIRVGWPRNEWKDDNSTDTGEK